MKLVNTKNGQLIQNSNGLLIGRYSIYEADNGKHYQVENHVPNRDGKVECTEVSGWRFGERGRVYPVHPDKFVSEIDFD